MAAKKVKLLVVGDGVQTKAGDWFHNGQVFTVDEREAEELLATGSVEKA